jgi:hypothetical protein
VFVYVNYNISESVKIFHACDTGYRTRGLYREEVTNDVDNIKMSD